MNTAEHDDRCWHELNFDELAAEAQEIYDRTADSLLGKLVSDLRAMPNSDRADMVISRIEDAHAG